MDFKKGLFFFRSLFPSWSFFTEVGDELILEARFHSSDKSSDWLPILPQIRRSPLNLFWNAHNNLIHACHNSLLHLLDDLQGAKDNNKHQISDLPSFKVIKNMVSFFGRKKLNSFSSYQFRIVIRRSPFYETKAKEDELLLLSPNYEFSE